jgi:hypothetical protein
MTFQHRVDLFEEEHYYYDLYEDGLLPSILPNLVPLANFWDVITQVPPSDLSRINSPFGTDDLDRFFKGVSST